tara:strand:+ start:90 stop:395 length:306 start_codon:yes stop_codon:yes gene_type:complete
MAYSPMRTLVMERDHYSVHYEPVETHTVIHCDVHKYNKTIRKQLLEDLDLLMSMRISPLITVHMDDDKHRKFLEMMGFELLTNGNCSDGKTHDIYIFDKQD